MKVRYVMPCLRCCNLLILLFFLSSFCTLLSAQERRPGRLFPTEKIHLLEEPRDWQDTDEIMARLGIKTGDIVADIGAGSGYFTVPLASKVGDTGLVFAEDIQIGMIDYISNKIESLDLKNVRVILGTIKDPSILDNLLNLAFVANTYHELEKPLAMLENIKKDLLPDGRLAIIDWDPKRESPLGPPLEERVPEDIVIKEAEETGFYLFEKHKCMPYHYFLIFKKKS